MKLTFRGHSVLVLGGSSDIGLALSALLLEEGLQVLSTHATARGKARISARFAESVVPIPFDLGNTESLALLKTKLADIDYLVDLAQADDEGLLASASETQAAAYFQAHITTRLLVLKEVCRHMLPRRFGRLVHVSSTAAALPASGQGFYSASKNAAEALYQSMGLELASRGISSLSLRLGLVDAGRGQRFLDLENRREHLAAQTVSVVQAASTLLFLLADEALGLTATTITMDAGLTARKYL